MRWCNAEGCGFKYTSPLEPGWAAMADELRVISDHLTIHNPSPAQWAAAYEKIQAAKEKAKKEK